MRSINLRIAGPTPLPPRVLQALSMQVIGHREPSYQQLHREVTVLASEFFQTKNDLFLFTSSGTGTMEAAIVNTLSPGDTVLAVTIGVFGNRFIACAKAHGLNVQVLEFPMGEAADPEKVAEAYEQITDCKAILITHNETSTAITNDLSAIVKAVREKAGEKAPLFLVDAVSSMGNVSLPVDELALDVVFTSSQKAWMAPPGIAMVSISRKAWDAYEISQCKKYYFDFGKMKKFHDKNQTPETPAVSTLFALREALRIMKERGVAQTFAYYADIAKYTREKVQTGGFQLFGDPQYASNVITAVFLPEGVEDTAFRTKLYKEHGVVLSGGKGEYKGKIVRIAHMGWVNRGDIDGAIEAMVRVRDELAK